MIKNERTWLMLWAVLQGLSLLMLHNWVTSLQKAGPYLYVILPLYVVSVALPLSMQMLSAFRRQPFMWRMVALYVLVATACASYIGNITWASGVADSVAVDNWSLGFIIFTTWFVLMPFAEHRLHHATWFKDYTLLFSAAWRNAVKIASAMLFVGVFWALLELWAGLFSVLGVRFFSALFNSRNFAYLVTAMTVGLGFSLYSTKEEALVGLYRATLNLLGWLMPMVAIIMLLFLVIVPIKGVSLLWGTGYATGLMLWLLCVMIFLFNAAWQDGDSDSKLLGNSLDSHVPTTSHQPKFPAWVLSLINLALMAMPIYVGLCAYALSLRIHQYGWTSDRVWAVLLVVLVSVYALGYAFFALKSFKTSRARNWMGGAERVNIIAALLAVFLLMLACTPVLNPAKIAVQSQVSRLLSQKVGATSFDYGYLRFEGGQYGDQALKKLQLEKSHPESATINKKATAVLKEQYRNWCNGSSAQSLFNEAILAKRLHTYPADAVLDNTFTHAIFTLIADNKIYIACVKAEQGCQVLLLDLNGDGTKEVVMLGGRTSNMFTLINKQWQPVGTLQNNTSNALSVEQIARELSNGEFSAVPSKWQDIKIGNAQYSVMPNPPTIP